MSASIDSDFVIKDTSVIQYVDKNMSFIKENRDVISFVLNMKKFYTNVYASCFLPNQGYDEAVGDHMEKNVGVGRIVHFNPPATPEESTAVVSGTAVIDYGKYAGQRVEFESSNCHAWGNSLAKADLSQVFNESKTFETFWFSACVTITHRFF